MSFFPRSDPPLRVWCHKIYVFSFLNISLRKTSCLPLERKSNKSFCCSDVLFNMKNTFISRWNTQRYMNSAIMNGLLEASSIWQIWVMRTTPTFSPCCQKSRRAFAPNLANYPDFSATRLFIHQPTGISLSFLWEGQAGGILKWNWMKLLFVPCSSSWPAVPITPICCRRRVSIFCHKSTLIIVTICLKNISKWE